MNKYTYMKECFHAVCVHKNVVIMYLYESKHGMYRTSLNSFQFDEKKKQM